MYIKIYVMMSIVKMIVKMTTI